VSAIWTEGSEGWQVLSPQGFRDEAALHDLIEQAPGLLPLAGSPQLAIVGREVSLGPNRADLMAIEPSGRPCIIEVKLAYNSEARRAVIGQVLSYASYLHRLTVAQLQNEILANHLISRGFTSLADAGRQAGQGGAFDEEQFTGALQDALDTGGLRLVIVLDSAPTELVQTVGFLEAVTDGLVIDLVTVDSYLVDGRAVMVPQRIEPDRTLTERSQEPRAIGPHLGRVGSTADGSDGFRATILAAPAEHRPMLEQLADWADELNTLSVRLQTYWGRRGEVTLLPKLRQDDAGLVTIWNWNGTPILSFWRSVFERRAPSSIGHIEALIAPDVIGQGTTISKLPPELLTALTAAYAEATKS
jgi:hypothetical protein